MITFTNLLLACKKALDFSIAELIIEDIYHYDVKPDKIFCNLMVTVCIKCNKIETALSWYGMMPHFNVLPTLLTCNSLLNALPENDIRRVPIENTIKSLGKTEDPRIARLLHVLSILGV